MRIKTYLYQQTRTLLEPFQGKSLIVRIKTITKATQSPLTSFPSFFNLLTAHIFSLLNQYLEGVDRITPPSHRKGTTFSTSLGRRQEECKVLYSWVALLFSSLCCLSKTLLSCTTLFCTSLKAAIFFPGYHAYFPTIFCSEIKPVLFCHHSPVFLICPSHSHPSHFFIAYLFCSTWICAALCTPNQKACQYSTLLRLFLLCTSFFSRIWFAK